MKRTLFTFVAAVLLFVAMSGNVWAQATAQISGTVKDQSGAVLPGVEITATQTETGASRMAITNETGSYILSNLPIGPYKLDAALPGFRTFVQTGIVLQVNGSPAINPVLEVGQVTEQVEVSANAALVETRNAGVGQVVENARILELPLNGRNVNELIALSGAAAPAAAQGSGRNPFLADTGVSVAGGSSIGLNYTLDGANHNNSFENTYLSMPFPDAMQEFKVETSATAVQNGVRPSGSVSLVTKSGTNEIHGDLFEFVRNGKFNARNAFATKRDTIKRNQFGGTAGGPIMKNKLFFFGGYQGTITPPGSVRHDYIRSDGRDGGGRFHSRRLASLQRRPADHIAASVRKQSDQSHAAQQSGREFPEAVASELRPVRKNRLRQPGQNGPAYVRRQNGLSTQRQEFSVRPVFGRQQRQPAGVYAQP